ncbi:unnamed protein product [Trichobilharzia regenti]|nr:unnamed protein product [Trichobilharzia regenti]
MLVKFIFPSLRSDNNLEVCRIQYYGSPKSLNLEWIAKAIFKITNLKRDTVFSLYYYGKYMRVSVCVWVFERVFNVFKKLSHRGS